jgi:hypothetical protein
MKKLLALLLLSPLAFAEKNEMIPLQEWMTKQNNIGVSETLYLSYRCIGLHTMMYSLLLNAPQEGATQTIKDIKKALETLIPSANIAYNTLTPEAERDFENNLSISTMPIAENYQLEANRSWTNTGQYFNDYIRADGEVCKVVTETFAKKNMFQIQ